MIIILGNLYVFFSNIDILVKIIILLEGGYVSNESFELNNVVC